MFQACEERCYCFKDIIFGGYGKNKVRNDCLEIMCYSIHSIKYKNFKSISINYFFKYYKEIYF